MYRGNCLGRDLRLAIVGQQAVDLLLDVSQLGVTKSSEKLERTDSLQQVAILVQQFFIRLERSVKLIQQVAFLGRDVFRYRQEATHFRQHDRLSTISRAACEEGFVY